MASNIHKLHHPTSSTDTLLAVVTEVAEGKAQTINISGTPFPVAEQFSSVEALHTGDRVLAMQSDAGLVVTGRLLDKDETPPPRFKTRNGHLLVEAEKSVRLRAGEHRIEVHSDGRIELDGCKITGYAEGRICLIGANIKLN